MSLLNWFKRGKRRDTSITSYSLLISTPSRGIPDELAEREGSQEFSDARDEMIKRFKRPDNHDPCFTELMVPGQGAVTITLPDSDRRALPVFTSPNRAGDYADTRLSSSLDFHYMVSSPLELVHMLGDVKEAGVDCFTIDPCPRCSILTTFGSGNDIGIDDILSALALARATEDARLDLYLSYVVHTAARGELEAARDVALETVGHVSADNPLLHLILGQIGVVLRDDKLFQEARAILEQLNCSDIIHSELDGFAKSGSKKVPWSSRSEA